MGCCASKTTTKLKKKPHFSSQELCHVQDKLVSSQHHHPPPPIRHYHSSRVSPVFPLSPTHSSSSSSFSRRCGTGSSSSVLTAKDRSFSNEFLWSCLRENPHVLYLDSIKEYSAANKLASNSPVPKQGNEKQSVLANSMSRSNSQKRVRSSSPSNLTRQKSFRRDYSDERLIRSPSPSRRFANRGISSIAETGNDGGCNSQRVVGLKANAARSISPYVKRDEVDFPAPAPASVVMKRKKNRETLVHRISSKIDESAVAEAMARYEGACDAMEEDIDNPMISLDCFIFL